MCAPSACKLRLQFSSPVDNIDAIEFYATSAGLDAVSNPPEFVGSKCIDSDEPSCLCQLIGATISLVGDSGEDIISMDIDKGRMSLTFLPFSLSESLLLRQPSKISLVHLVRNKGRWGLVPDDARFQQFGY
eukprot:scaffold11112_cov69-Cyclotella_meneghiniana.AAC.4